ncbi:MAG: chromosome segregation protein SMC [Candidatus Nanopelagicales bacterium]|nr:chromosome segregation protein SMC [Candidatus Nanopelagicales bacterium]MDP4824437.1 chromosome segregation protein SMC [Candidatus Nanopelagicales bacterium]
MHLKSLTLKGFKSFASATTFAFEPGVTAVVGPNGSGKSNVVDGLAWVMGEQGAKSLRGGHMTDVIFAGTSGRAPLGRAEVSLTIDNTDGALPIEFTEVTISRTLFRNGGSEYAINGQSCRLLDVQELLSDSGIGREMHVIVGQGQLDAILHATADDRRGFIEEAAGVLKHRKRKEKALRKLDAMEGNLTRVTDLVTELRRQLKPLGKQAEVARRATVIQADARDAAIRLMADELHGLETTLQAEVADETALRARRAVVESDVARLTERENELARLGQEEAPLLARAQQSWFQLSAVRERLLGSASLATDRMRRNTEDDADSGPDPDELDAQAKQVRAEEFHWRERVDADRGALASAISARQGAEDALAAEGRRVAGEARAAADRRESLARLGGQVGAAQSRLEARTNELERLSVQRDDAVERGRQAQVEFQTLESQVAGLDEGELGLDTQYEVIQRELADIDVRVESLREQERESQRQRAALQARVDALSMSQSHGDGADTVLAQGEQLGVLGTVSSLVRVTVGAERAVAAVLGPLAEAVVVRDVQSALDSLILLRSREVGRATLVVSSPKAAATPHGAAPAGSRWVQELVSGPAEVLTGLQHVWFNAVIVADLGAAQQVLAINPNLVVVTEDGDLLGGQIATGGSGSGPTLLEIQAAIDEAQHSLAEVNHTLERTRFALSVAQKEQEDTEQQAQTALARLHDSDARLAAVAEQLGHWGQQARSAIAEAERLGVSAHSAEQARAADETTLRELQEQLRAVADERVVELEDHQHELSTVAEQVRQQEMESRLAVRTGEERIQALAAQAESLERAARAERSARQRAAERREQRRREAEVATDVLAGVEIALAHLDESLRGAEVERGQRERNHSERDSELLALRQSLRELVSELDRLTDSVHRDEVARTEQRLRIEQLHLRCVDDFGLEPHELVAEYGPEQMVPPTPLAPGDEEPEVPRQPYPYVRAEQLARLKTAERGLALLGRVNPLALEEYAALEERLLFLTEQVEDLRRSRADLMAIVKDVDERIEQVFTEAYHDTAGHFSEVFGRLFPGGEGRLILTDPDNMLTTGIEVEARPPGKKVKRLSLLSGGERSLTAVAFLIALFKARPSPFYVLDEVEAALDDVNLGRLIDAINELRDTSQLIVITHQKRTMEIADALYGVSMRGDGVSQVVGQRLRERESA